MYQIMNPKPPLSLYQHIRVLGLLVEGKTQDQIALDLGLSRDTIKQRCKRIKQDLGVQSLYQAVAVAVSNGWVQAPKGNQEIPKSVNRE